MNNDTFKRIMLIKYGRKLTTNELYFNEYENLFSSGEDLDRMYVNLEEEVINNEVINR